VGEIEDFCSFHHKILWVSVMMNIPPNADRKINNHLKIEVGLNPLTQLLGRTES
jgi:hypothetical protein